MSIKRVSKSLQRAAKLPKGRSVTRRNWQRVCNECAACMRVVDCGSCDFCRDMSKFGGSSVKRQKCRWRQCLFFARKHLLPAWRSETQTEELDEWEVAEEWEWEKKRMTRKRKTFAKRALKKTKQAAQRMPRQGHYPHQRAPPETVVNATFKERNLKAGGLLITLRDPVIKLQRLEDSIKYQALLKEGRRSCPFSLNTKRDSTEDKEGVGADKGLSMTPRGRPPPRNTKEDLMEREGSDSDDSDCIIVQTPRKPPAPLDTEAFFEAEVPSAWGGVANTEDSGPENPTSRPVALNIEDFLIKGEEEEAEDAEGLPVIMEIFSLGSYQAISRQDHA